MSRPASSHEPELTAFEAQLAALRPGSTGINRDRLMFEMGQAGHARRPRLVAYSWAATALYLALGVVLGVSHVRSPAPQSRPNDPSIQVASHPDPGPIQTRISDGNDVLQLARAYNRRASHAHLRALIGSSGASALALLDIPRPDAPPSGSRTQTIRSWRELLESELGFSPAPRS